MTVMQIVRRPLDIFDLYSTRDRERRVLALLDMVGIASNQVYRYPHEFSGGQRQRISIARALAVEPSVLIADEPTSALDVSIQCQILDLLTKLRNELGLTMIFVSHDLGVINHITERVAVMYLGHIIERGKTRQVFKTPAHPYTKALLEALPTRASTSRVRRIRLEGYIPSPINPPKGCLLHPRCPYAQQECAIRVPEWEQFGTHSAACHYAKTQNFQPKTLVT
jgi:oligopeptide/dipeptide ABC transporter ATP-binding protein